MAIAAVLLFTFVVGAVFWYLTSFLRRRSAFLDVVNKIPGPKAIPIFGNTLTFKLDRVGFSYQLEEISTQYGLGGVLRIWMGEFPLIIFTNAESAEPLLSSNRLITKSNNYDILLPWLGTGLLTSTGEKWKSRRKMLTPTFHFSILNGFVDVFNKEAQVLCQCLAPLADSGVSFDIFPFVGRAALDIICETSMGTAVNAQRKLDSDYVKAVKHMSEIVFKHERSPWLWLKPLFYLFGYGFEYDRCLKILKEFTNKVISDRIVELQSLAEANKVSLENLEQKIAANRRLAFLDLLILMKDKNQLTLEDIREEVDTFMFEGHDTTSSGMSWTLFMLGHHPEIQDKIYEEITRILGDTYRPASKEDLKEMKYLNAVVKEGLRMFPPVPLFARRVTEDFESAGYKIPVGSTAMVIPFLIHRNPKVWDKPDEFRPERFLSENHDQERHAFSYVPFSAGARNCIGQKFAQMEEKIVLATIIRHYKVISLEPIKAVRPCPDVILRPPDKFLVRLIKR